MPVTAGRPGYLIPPGTLTTDAEAAAAYEAGSDKILYVSPNGDDGNTGQTMSTAFETVTAALTAMGTDAGTIHLDAGTISAGATLAWPATAKCGMVGQGPRATILQAASQTGPVLDLSASTGYVLQEAFFGGFTIKGDNTAGTAKKGLKLSSAESLVRGHFRDIVVEETGGACFDLGVAELCTFDRLVANTPVSAVANDVPYFTATGPFNGNTMTDCQIYGNSSASGCVGPSGALYITDDGSYNAHDTKIDGLRIQSIILPTNTSAINVAVNGFVISGMQFFDCGKVSGATGTAHLTFALPAVSDLGGNLVTGIIPGKGTNATDIDAGIRMDQSRNMVIGTKGFRGTNVIIGTGIDYTRVELGGATAASTDVAVTDSSGLTGSANHNVIVDAYLGTHRQYQRQIQQPDDATKARLAFGTGGAYLLQNGSGTGALYVNAQDTSSVNIRAGGTDVGVFSRSSAPALTLVPVSSNYPGVQVSTASKYGVQLQGASGPILCAGSGSPEGVLPAAVGSLYMRTDGGTSTALYVKETGTTTSSGWVAK